MFTFHSSRTEHTSCRTLSSPIPKAAFHFLLEITCIRPEEFAETMILGGERASNLCDLLAERFTGEALFVRFVSIVTAVYLARQALFETL